MHQKERLGSFLNFCYIAAKKLMRHLLVWIKFLYYFESVNKFRTSMTTNDAFSITKAFHVAVRISTKFIWSRISHAVWKLRNAGLRC